MKKSMINFELTEQQLEGEIKRIECRYRRRATVKSGTIVVATLCAMAMLSTLLWFPVFRISSENDEFILAFRTQSFGQGDMVSFYQENQRVRGVVIAQSGDLVAVDERDTVTVNGTVFKDAVLMTSNVTYPFQVPEGSCLARTGQQLQLVNTSTDQSVAKVLLRIWPLERFEYFG